MFSSAEFRIRILSWDRDVSLGQRPGEGAKPQQRGWHHRGAASQGGIAPSPEGQDLREVVQGVKIMQRTNLVKEQS